MTKRWLDLILSGPLASLLATTTSFAEAAPNTLPPESNAYGKGYAQLAAEWLEWLLAIPAASSPLLDPDGAFAAVGQSGKVWFLAGTVGGPATRSVTVPTGTALFFPIVNFFWLNTPEYGDPPWSPDQAKHVKDDILTPVVDAAHGLILEIDGRTVQNVDSLRVYSELGECTVPDDNIFGAPFDPVPHACVADGYLALLPPLSAGNHTIHFAGGIAAVPPYQPVPFSLDVTYHITVRGR
jgi:hypothetical protein